MRAYYASRKGPTVAELGRDYWRKTDPDGRVRDMTRPAERTRKLIAMRHELDALEAECVRIAPRPKPAGKLPFAITPQALDVGCGVGHALQALCGQGWDTHGVEPDPTARGIAIGRCPDAEVWRAVPTKSGYDAALCYHVIEHVAEPMPFIESVLRCLRPNGLLVIGTPDFDSPGARKHRKRFRLLHDETHVSLFSTRSLCALLEDYGASIERVHYPEPPAHRKLTRGGKWSPPEPGNIVTVYARRGSVADEIRAADQRSAWTLRAASDLLGVAKELV
jgi:SAM-dependent methyltransferase